MLNSKLPSSSAIRRDMSSTVGWLIRHLRPLWLREKVFYHLVFPRLRPRVSEPEVATLAFAKGITMRLMPTDVGHQVILATGFYELEVTRRISQLAKVGGLLVDVGANYGYYAAIWAAQNIRNRAICYEPMRSNVEAIHDLVSRNGLDMRIQILQRAVGKESGTMSFRAGGEGQTGQGGLVSSPKTELCKVEVVSLDEEFRDSELVIDVLKIDVEGADTWVLEGAATLFEQKRVRHVFFEQFPRRMDELGVPHRSAFDFLALRDYAVSELSPGQFYGCPAPTAVEVKVPRRRS